MAARRLIALLIALLIISTIAAALAPEREETTTEPQTATDTERPSPAPGGDVAGVLRERVPADPDEPQPISAAVGDQLALVVEVESPAQVAIGGLGLSDFATPLDPVRFDILFREPGTHEVTAGGETVAHLEVE